MTRQDLVRPGPQLTEPAYGPEPSVRQILIFYYEQTMDREAASEMADRYIDVLLAMADLE